MLRQALLLLARSQHVKELVTRMPVSNAVVNRYVPGEQTDLAVEATRVLIGDGLLVTLDFLGEDTNDQAQAELHWPSMTTLDTRARAIAAAPVPPGDSRIVMVSSSRAACRKVA